MASIKAGILNSQTTPEPIDPDLKIYGVDGLPTKSEHMPTLNVVRTDNAVGMTPADFHNVFPFNEIVNENVPTFVEYGHWDEKNNTFDNQSQMVSKLSDATTVFYEHLFGGIGGAKSAYQWYGNASYCRIYIKDPNNRYKYVIASGTKFGKPIDFEICFYEMDNMDAYLQEMMYEMDTSYVYPVVRYGFSFLFVPSTAVCGYIYHDGTEWVRTVESISLENSYLQMMDNIIPKHEITTSSTFKTLNDNKYWQYNGGTSYTIADFDEIPIPQTPTKRIPKFYVKRGMNLDGTWYEKISKTKHDETWLCHKAFISADDGLEKPYIYLASEIVTSSYRDLREDRGNFKVYGETEYDMFETLFRIAYGSWMSTYSEEDENGTMWIIADLKEFGIEYLDCVLRVDTKYEEGLGTSVDGVGFGRPFAFHNGMNMRVSEISTFRNVKGENGNSLSVPSEAPADGAMYHFNEIEISGNDIFKYVDILSENDDPNPVIRQSTNPDIGPDNFGYAEYQRLSNNLDQMLPVDVKTVLFDIPLTLAASNQEMGGMYVDLYVGTNGQLQALYDACVNETIPLQINDPCYVNDDSTLYYGDVSGDIGFPIPLYNFGPFNPAFNTSFIIGDLTPLGMGLGLVLAKIVNISIPNNNIVISYKTGETLVGLRDIEYYMRSGSFWPMIYNLRPNASLTLKEDEFNPSLMELHTYTKTSNRQWDYWGHSTYGQQQPNDVGIGTGILGFLSYFVGMTWVINLAPLNELLRIKFLNAQYYQYDVLLYPVKTRLVMLP